MHERTYERLMDSTLQQLWMRFYIGLGIPLDHTLGLPEINEMIIEKQDMKIENISQSYIFLFIIYYYFLTFHSFHSFHFLSYSLKRFENNEKKVKKNRK